MLFEHDEDDPPPQEGWYDLYWGLFNRWAEHCAAYARTLGLLP